MAIAFRSIANTTYAGGRTSTVVNKPSGLAVGDFMLWAQVTAASSFGPDPTFPGGWTQIAPLAMGAGGFNADFRVAYKFADSSDAAASDFTATHTSCSSQGAIACWTGVDATTPLDVTPTQNFSNGGVADSTALSLTTVTNGAGIVIWGLDWADTTNNLTAPAGTTPTFTERLDVTLVHMFEGNLATAGATGDKTWANNASTSNPWGVHMLALRPAGSADTEDDLLANNVGSASSVTQPAVKQLHGLLANDVTSASSVTSPALTEIALGQHALLANDVTSASGVTSPALHQAQSLLANDVTSASHVGQPMLDRPEVEIPEPGGGGGKVYGRGFPRRRWEELLRQLEQERQEALERAETFKGTKGRKRAITAARAASEAIAAAREAADEAAVIAHAGTITRMLEGAAQAKSLTEYLERMKAAKAEAEEMEDENDVETVLMMVA